MAIPLEAPGRLISIIRLDRMLGRRLGVYEVHSRLGAGGMGEVYQASDTRLGREVAIKVLPAIFTSDAGRLARFEREARVLASLNHPNVGAIYGLEEADGVRALVLELIPGDTLTDRLAHAAANKTSRPGLPLTECVAIARQIADALDAAHEKGIVHRDLKPANVKITPEGGVKVLDFGLAKIDADDQPNATLTHSPTMIAPTQSGVILGTAAYMSPEQARGLGIDKRTDIWAFGCVLFEMLTGRATFGRATLSDTIASILEHAPDWSALPDDTPAGVSRLLRRCLEKNAKRRMRDIGDALLELDDREQKPTTSSDADRSTRRSSFGWPFVVASVVALSLGVVGYGVAVMSALLCAPDLAMTQFAVETLTVVIVVLVFSRLRGVADLSSRLVRVRDACVAIAAGALVTTLVLFIGASGTKSRLAAYFADAAPRLAHGYNIVNVILVDFRGFDTMGEITVLVTVAIGVRALLLIGRERGQ